MKRLVQLAAVALFLALDGGTAALTPAECQFFAEDGTTEICHATRSPRHPYVLLRASEQACIAHSEHPADFVALGGSCDAGACLPIGAPCDQTIPCCSGACTNGICDVVAPELIFEPSDMPPAQ